MRTRAETAEESVYQMRAEVSREREQKSVLQRELDTARAETSRLMNQLAAFDLQAATFAEEKQRLADQVRVRLDTLRKPECGIPTHAEERWVCSHTQVKEQAKGMAATERRAERAEEDLATLRKRLRSGTESTQLLVEENVALGSQVRGPPSQKVLAGWRRTL